MYEHFTIGNSDANSLYYIYSSLKSGWLHKTEDRWLDSRGANSSEWDGYYNTRAEAEARLELFKTGKTVSVIHIGGE